MSSAPPDQGSSTEALENSGCQGNHVEECERRFKAIEATVFGESEPPSAKPGPIACYFVIIYWESGQVEDERPHVIDRSLYDDLRTKLDNTIDTRPENTEIDVWIDSGGGDPHIAYKLLLDLRSRCTKLRAVIPDYAKSAATLLVLGMDEIYMAGAAELGPLDVQVSHPLREELTVSALDVSGALEYLGRLAVSLTAQGGPELLKWTGLARADILREILPFSAKVVEPAIAQLDPHLVHRAHSQLRITRDYAKRALTSRNVSPDDRLCEGDVEELCNHLVTNYPSHGFVISKDEARDLRLPIRELRDYHAAAVVKATYTKYLEEHRDVCHVIKATQREKDENPDKGPSGAPTISREQDMAIDGENGAKGEPT